MQIEKRLENIERELESLKMLIMFESFVKKTKPVTLKGMCKILVSEEELDKSIEMAKKSLFGEANVLRN